MVVWVNLGWIGEGASYYFSGERLGDLSQADTRLV